MATQKQDNTPLMELGKTSHSSYKIRYHMVTAVKYRKALLSSEVEECIKETMKGISERYEIVIDEMGFDQNHIHIFCGSHPRMAPMKILSIIKSIGCGSFATTLKSCDNGQLVILRSQVEAGCCRNSIWAKRYV